MKNRTKKILIVIFINLFFLSGSKTLNVNGTIKNCVNILGSKKNELGLKL